jgi:segregation and condensation protein A
MSYLVTIDNFSGPLDLLLHLIKQSNIDIYDIKIEEITKQYLDYIETMSNMNLDIASSYLVMASELIEMKSSYLLPKKEKEVDEYEEDPKERLIKRLVEYRNYKEAIEKFHELEVDRQNYYTKPSSELSDFEKSNKLPTDVDLSDLLDAFSKFLSRKEIEKPLNTKITNKEYSIQERSSEIKNLIKKSKKVSFNDLFTVRTRSYIVITFLSILSLAKNNEINIKQDNNFEEILLYEVGYEF